MTTEPNEKPKKNVDVPKEYLDQVLKDAEVQQKLANLDNSSKIVAETIKQFHLSPTMLAAKSMLDDINKLIQIHQPVLAALQDLGAKTNLATLSNIAGISSILEKLNQDQLKIRDQFVEPIRVYHEQPAQKVNIDAAMMKKIAELEEENEELRRTIELLRSKKKGEYIQ